MWKIEFRLTRFKAVSVVIVALMGMATFFCMGNASHLIDALVPMVLGTNMLISGLLLILAFVYYRPSRSEDGIWKPSDKKNYLYFSLRYFAPVLLTIILIGNLWQEAQHLNLAVSIRWGWLIVAAGTSACIVYYTSKSSRVNASEPVLTNS